MVFVAEKKAETEKQQETELTEPGCTTFYPSRIAVRGAQKLSEFKCLLGEVLINTLERGREGEKDFWDSLVVGGHMGSDKMFSENLWFIYINMKR